MAASARLMIIGQAPGTKVHETGIPWNDRSGDQLRQWLGLDRDVFYDETRIAIMPMGFCYPGRDARGGDSPPRPEDRKSVVSGKSVSERVDLRGRRIIKKKTNYNYKCLTSLHER